MKNAPLIVAGLLLLGALVWAAYENKWLKGLKVFGNKAGNNNKWKFSDQAFRFKSSKPKPDSSSNAPLPPEVENFEQSVGNFARNMAQNRVDQILAMYPNNLTEARFQIEQLKEAMPQQIFAAYQNSTDKVPAGYMLNVENGQLLLVKVATGKEYVMNYEPFITAW